MQQKEIEKEVEEVTTSTVLMPSKKRNGRTPENVSSSDVTSNPIIRNKKLRKMFVPDEIEEEEEETWVFLTRRKKIADAETQKDLDKTVFKEDQLLASTMVE